MKYLSETTAIGVFIFSVTTSFADNSYRNEFKELQEKHEKDLAAAVEPINRRYQGELQQFLKKATQAGDLETALKVKEALQIPAPAEKVSVGAGEPVPSDLEARVLGDWILENAQGKVLYPVQIERQEAGVVRLTRSGGSMAFFGIYKLEGNNLVKQPRPGDPNPDMTWHYAGGHLKLKVGPKSFYNDWVLKKK
jgi:hypothetical protein